MDETWIKSFKRGLHGEWSHPDPFQAVRKMDYTASGKTVEGLPFTIWQIMCHTLDWAWEMVNVVRGAPLKNYQEDNFYPAEKAPPDRAAWDAHLQSWQELELVLGEVVENFDPGAVIKEMDNITHADALMVAIGHSAYHTAQMVMMARMLGVWEGKDKG